jgi:hypothetical protein
MVTHTGYANVRFSEWNVCGWPFTDAEKGVFAGGNAPKILAPANVTSMREKSLNSLSKQGL